jgi:tight adherence protein C
MNPIALALSIGLVAGLGVFLVYWGLVRLGMVETPKQRLQRLAVSPHPLEQAELDAPFMDRVIFPWFRRQVQAAGRLAPSRNIEKLRESLVRAGYPYGWTVLDLLGIKLLAGLGTAVGTVYFLALRRISSLQALVFPLLAGAIAFLLPDFWLGSRARRRKADITRSLPDALDMLTICVDAGAGLDSGMLKINERWQNAIAAEFGKVVAEVRIGLSRREALQNMAWRTDVPEVGSFVAVLIQAEQFGLSIASVLHTQSEQMRVRRWQRAEEEARKVPIKLLFPLIFMIFPSLIAVTIGPAVPILMRTFSQMLR